MPATRFPNWEGILPVLRTAEEQPDVLVAATAVAQHATLVTRKTQEFGRITGLAMVDWYG